MGSIGRIGSHAVVAGALFFLFQRFGLGATLETSTLWGIVGAVGAAVLAWSQQQRR